MLLTFYVSGFRFPFKNKVLLSQWTAAIKRDKWAPKTSDYICSAHFTDNCFRKYVTQVRLREDAVPTVFDFPPHLVKPATTPRREILKFDVTNATIPSTSTPVTSEQQTSQDSSDSDQIKAKAVLQQHNYALLRSPRAVKRKLEEQLSYTQRMHEVAVKRLKVVRRSLFRQKKRLSNMKSVIDELKQRKDINAEAVSLIERCFGHIPAEMLRQTLYTSKNDAYSDTVRSFALTLHFYSPQAYDFVRRSFSSTLPHVSTLRRWTAAVEGKPGFTEEAFEVSIYMQNFKCSNLFTNRTIA